MSWLENIRQQSKQKKITTIWTITAVVCAILITLWIIIGNYNTGKTKDFTLFKTLDQGFRDVSKQNFKKTLPPPGKIVAPAQNQPPAQNK